MRKFGTILMAIAVLGVGATSASADIVIWNDIIGIIQAGNPVGSGTGQVTGGGQPWSTTSGINLDRARVNLSSGAIRFSVRGLVLAGGNGIGSPGAVDQVMGTLVCDTDGSAGVVGNSVLVDTPLVRLNARGNALFIGNIGTLPAVCVSEPDIAFLVRTAGGNWIANGAVRRRIIQP